MALVRHDLRIQVDVKMLRAAYFFAGLPDRMKFKASFLKP